MLDKFDKKELKKFEQELKIEYQEDIQREIDALNFRLEIKFDDFLFEKLVIAEEALENAPTRNSQKLFETHIKQSVIDYRKQQASSKLVEKL